MQHTIHPSTVRISEIILLVVTLPHLGCGGKPSTYPAGGNVIFADGRPLAGGWVSFRSLEGANNIVARGPVKEDGTFELTTFEPGDGAVLGPHQAVVTAAVFGSGQRDVPQPKLSQPIDRKYSSYDTSGLDFTVTNDPQRNRFEITVTAPKN